MIFIKQNKTNGIISFDWIGKEESKQEAYKLPTKELIPCKEESKYWENTNNIYIEGENLEVLKILQKKYYNKIKAIYIDPPYNINSKSLVFNDDMEKYNLNILNGISLQNDFNFDYLADINWINMMYPRLKLAKNLLTDDGVMFISIDEREINNLTYICEEIFGKENICGSFIWHNRTVMSNSQNGFSQDHEYILICCKNIDLVHFQGRKKDLSVYKNPDNDPNGLWVKGRPCAPHNHGSCVYSITNPYTGEVYNPPRGRGWSFCKETLQDYIKTGKIVFPKKEGEMFYIKQYLSELRNVRVNRSSLIDGVYSFKGTKELREIFHECGNIFTYPKPTELIETVLDSIILEDDIVLDFFAGSGTTAHAVFNLEHKNNFILIQQPELLNKESDAHKIGINNISDITKERILRVGNKFPDRDTGFKVYKLKNC